MTPLRASARLVFVSWLILSTLFCGLAARTISQTGLDYDEAVYGHLAKDFLLDRSCPQHMPGSESIEIAGRPFPLFVQGYLGGFKCWMLIPSFTIWGTSVAVMRWTMVAVALLGILLLMLWVRRTWNLPAAVAVGPLTAFDPSFFFPSICEWGAFVPSFLCRCAALLCLALWWEKRHIIWISLAGAALGLGFFNKIDFLVVIAAIGAAAFVSVPRELVVVIRQSWKHCLAGLLVLVLTSAPMIWNSLRWLRSLVEVQTGERSGELTTKVNVIKAALDGSYFHRLMEVGGLFHRMFERPASFVSVFAVALGFSLLVLIVKAVRYPQCRWPRFCLIGLLVTALGFLLLPEALRIHHFLLVYPFPQLIVTGAAVVLWQDARSAGKIVAAVAISGILLSHFANLWRTQRFIAATGGRGQWSMALTQFAATMKDRDDVMLVSLDWGFHEQLSFLTEKPQCFDPTWNLQAGKPIALLPDPKCHYLLHPQDFSLFPYGEQFLQMARESGRPTELTSITNLEGRVVFQFFRFKAP